MAVMRPAQNGGEMPSVRTRFGASIVALAFLLAMAPAAAQPAPPAGPAAGPANPPPWLKPNADEGRRRSDCDMQWRRLHGAGAAVGTPAYFGFLDRCLKGR